MYRLNIINVMEDAARAAGDAMLRDYGELVHLQREKGRRSYFSRTRDFAHKRISGILLKAKPELSCYDSVSQQIPANGWQLHLFDGDLNLLRGAEQFALGIALVEAGATVAAVLYSPVCNKFFWAQKDGGAYFENRRLRCQHKCPASNGILAAQGDAEVLEWVTRLVEQTTCELRVPGAINLAMATLAAGNYDAVFCTEKEHAGALIGSFIAEEAGVATTFFPETNIACLASSEITRCIEKLAGNKAKD